MASLGQEDKPGGGRCMISWLRRMDVCGTKLIGRDRLPPCSPSSTECLHAGPCICSAPGWVLHAGPASPPLLVGAGCPIRLLCSEPGARDLDHCSSRTGTEQTVSFSPRPADRTACKFSQAKESLSKQISIWRTKLPRVFTNSPNEIRWGWNLRMGKKEFFTFA